MNLVYEMSTHVKINTIWHLIRCIKCKLKLLSPRILLLGTRLSRKCKCSQSLIWHRSGIKRWHIHIRTILLNSSQIFHNMLSFVVTEWSTLLIKVWWHIPYALVASMSCFLHEHVYTKRHIDCMSFTFPWHIKANNRLIYK